MKTCVHEVDLDEDCKDCERETRKLCNHRTELTGEFENGSPISKCEFCFKEFYRIPPEEYQ